MHCYTSITNNYFPKARVLAQTLARYNPEWKLHVILSEPVHPAIDPATEPFASIVGIDEIGIPDLMAFLFMHRVTEICTAVKGIAAQYLIRKHALRKIVYFDPDIAIFNDLSPLSDLLDAHPILLAPHLSKPEVTAQAVVDNEICALRHGVFNLGFLGLRAEGQGLDFLEWWTQRNLEHCFDDIPLGLFTDQRWCDFAPIFFDQLYILREPQYDVATWNLQQRTLSMGQDGTLLVDGLPLRFYHFSGYDTHAGRGIVRRLFEDRSHVIHEVWAWYDTALKANGQALLGSSPWFYSTFSDGTPITSPMRTQYRSRPDLQAAFPNPFDTDQRPQSFLRWCKINLTP